MRGSRQYEACRKRPIDGPLDNPPISLTITHSGILSTRILGLLAFGSALLAYGGSWSPQTASEQARVVTIDTGNEIKYSVAEIRAAPGEDLRIVLRNLASKADSEVIHNIHFLDQELSDDQLRDSFLSDQMDVDLPENLREICFGSSPTVGPEGSAELAIKAPLQKGKYTFFCSVPGHVFIGMHGILIVE